MLELAVIVIAVILIAKNLDVVFVLALLALAGGVLLAVLAALFYAGAWLFGYT